MQCSQDIAWMGVHTAVPADWDIVRHSLSRFRGSLYFVDRRQQRLQVTWVSCRTKPDLQQMISDYRSRSLEGDPKAAFEDLDDVRGWVGTHRLFKGGEALTRAIWFDTPTSRLLELVLHHQLDTEAGRQQLDELMDVSEVTDPIDRCTHWRAFGLDVKTPPGWRMEGTNLLPGDTTFRFRLFDPERDVDFPAQFYVRRVGMLENWFDGDFERYLQKQEKRTRFRFTRGMQGGTEVVRAEATEKGPRIKRVVGLLRRRRDMIWTCPQENALYHVTALSPQKRPVEADLFRVQSMWEAAA